ncbi:MAG TPA: ADP-ribosylation factor-like protein [Candidatus Lokiarchaeia archaeon]|nr:ADP-ribosylation factor-like protein [Candidatus Lokiarchaeia archaeon]
MVSFINSREESSAFNKKLVLVGPAAAGKTTFKRVFFENANPLQLLDEGLDPTRGIENTVVKCFSEMIAVWDLAGQELHAWLDEQKEVFQDAEVIVCMLDASQKLRESTSFLINLLKVRQEISPDAVTFVLLNKCDMVSESEAYNTIVTMADFISTKYPQFAAYCNRTSIYRTSIAQTFFLKTMMIAFKIIKTCLKMQAMDIPDSELNAAEKKIQILQTCSSGVWFSIQDIAYKLSLTLVQVNSYIEDLVFMDMMEKRKRTFYRISQRGVFFTRACDTHPDLIQSHDGIETMDLFMKLGRIGKQDG